MTIQTAFRLDEDLKGEIKQHCEKEGRSQTWVANKAFRDYLDKHAGVVSVKKPVAKKAVAIVENIDYSVFNLTNFYLDEISRIRTKNADSAKKAKMTQRIANALAKEFNKAYMLGFTIDQILDEWESRGWKSFKAEWLKPDKAAHNNQDSNRTRDKTVQQQLSDKSWAN